MAGILQPHKVKQREYESNDDILLKQKQYIVKEIMINPDTNARNPAEFLLHHTKGSLNSFDIHSLIKLLFLILVFVHRNLIA
jgi:hypothetical protein